MLESRLIERCYPVIIAGGWGKRFWPYSDKDNPKQFLKINGPKSLIEETFERILPIFKVENVLFIVNKRFTSRVQNLFKDVPAKNIFGEPQSKNTAAAIAVATVLAHKRNSESILVVLPADHYIPDRSEFLRCLSVSIEAAEKYQKIVLLGIMPTRPESGYGYIQRGERVDKKAFRVVGFTEKPDVERARQFLKQGSYLWNCGIFIASSKVLLDSFSAYMPMLFEGIIEVLNHLETDQQEAVINAFYERTDEISFDYGVMEKTKDSLVVEASFEWDDLGDWLGLERIFNLDGKNNLIMAEEHKGIDTQNCIIVSDDHKICTLGVKDLVIVSKGDKILICNKNKTQIVKDVIR